MVKVQQLFRVCRALLSRVGLEDLWTTDGPTERAKRMLAEEGQSLSRDQRMVMFLVWRFYSGVYEVRETELGELDDATRKAVMNAAAAMRDGADAVDRWLEAEAATKDET